jgi:hypothetical protein
MLLLDIFVASAVYVARYERRALLPVPSPLQGVWKTKYEEFDWPGFSVTPWIDIQGDMYLSIGRGDYATIRILALDHGTRLHYNDPNKTIDSTIPFGGQRKPCRTVII